MYAVLTGQAPYRGSNPAEVLSKARRSDFRPPRQVKNDVPRALEAICQKAMAFQPEQRYGTAKELAADVEQWLADQPVSAWREPWQVRARRWLGRHRTMVTTAVAALLVATVSLTAALLVAERLRGLAQQKEQEALASQQQAMEALRATTDDVVEQLLGGKPVLGPAEKAFLEKTLNRWQAFADAAGEGEQARAIRAEGMHRVAKLRANLGQRDEAVLGYREGIALRQKLVDDYPGVPQHRQDLALTYAQLGDVFRYLGKQQDRETAVRQALALREELAAEFPDEPEYHFDEADSHYDLGGLLRDQGKYAEAESSYRRALVLYNQLVTASPAVAKYRRNMALSHRMLGNLLKDQRRFTEAETAHREGIALLERLVAEFPAVPDYRDHLARSNNDLGTAFDRQGKIREAEASLRAGLANQEKLAADFPAVPDYRRALAQTYNNLGNALRQQGKQEAEAVLRQGLAIAEKLVADFPTVPEYRYVLGLIQSNLGESILHVSKEPEKALPWYDKGIATEEEALRRGGSITRVQVGLMFAHHGRAAALSALQRHAEALKDYDKMVELAPEPERPYQRSIRAAGRVRAGQVAPAIEEAEELAKNADSGVLYNLACVYALASVPTNANPISSEQQAKYAERAIALLRQVVVKGGTNANEMKNDDDLKPLHQRDDFQKLLREMQKEPP
jgi:tetratricopeptide (TPR) repeat protein